MTKHDPLPRDVTVLDLEKIVQYIYTGDCQVENTSKPKCLKPKHFQVAGPSLQSFLCLARSLGLPEFIEQVQHVNIFLQKHIFSKNMG